MRMKNRNSDITLQEILERRRNALADVRQSAGNIKTLAGKLFEPPSAEGRFGDVMNNVERFMAVYDGILLGTKVIRRVRGLIRRR